VAALRASDADRDRTVAALRHHAAAGRLTLDELDTRSERAYTAQTLDELAQLQADLPAVATRPRRGHATLAPGWHSFTARWHSPVSTEMAMAELVADLAPEIQERGFDLIQRADDRLRFETRRRPGWTWAVVVLVPIFGWFALLHKEIVRITIDVAETERGTQIVAGGVAPLAIRSTFAELED
jgi:Domain of unknown function (DUF1707)